MPIQQAQNASGRGQSYQMPIGSSKTSYGMPQLPPGMGGSDPAMQGNPVAPPNYSQQYQMGMQDPGILGQPNQPWQQQLPSGNQYAQWLQEQQGGQQLQGSQLMGNQGAQQQYDPMQLQQIQQQANAGGQQNAYQGPNSGGQTQGAPSDIQGGNRWQGFDQGYPWQPYDPTNPFPTPGQGWNGAPQANAQMQMMNSLSPGFTNTLPPGYAGFDPNSRANQFNLMSGIFANDPMELPGEQAGPMLGAAANLTLSNAMNREGRNDMAQQGLLDAIYRTGSQPGVGGSAMLSNQLATNPFTTSGDDIQQMIEGILNRGNANAREGALQSAQGALGSSGARGGEAGILESGVDFGARAAQADSIAKAKIDQAMRRSQDISNAQNQFRGTSDIFAQNVMGPAAIGADFLSNRQNVDTNALIEQMRAMAGLGMAENIRKDSDVSTLEAYMPGIVNLLGNLFGGMSGGGGG